MAQGWQSRLGDLFPHCEVLPVAPRRRLATLLAVEGALAAVLPEDLARLPLPVAVAPMASVCRAVEDGLEPDIMATMGVARLAELVPAIGDRAGPVAVATRGRRLQQLLERNRATSWDVLGGLTLDEIGAWSGVGPRTAATVIGLALEAGLAFLADDEALRTPSTGSPAGPCGADAEPADDLALLLDHDRRAGSGALGRAIGALTGHQHPEAVRTAAARLAGGHTGRSLLSVLDRALSAAGDDRDRGVFEQRSLRVEGRPTIARLAATLGIGPERVRQLRARAGERVRDALAAAPATAAERAAEMGRELGAAATAERAAEVVVAAGLPQLPDARSLLALWLAGPYQPVDGQPGWIATDPVELVVETRRLLHEDGGVRLLEQVTKELEVLGMVPSHIGAWLARQPVRVVDGLVVLTAGPPAEMAERVLSATGVAMTTEELSSWARSDGTRHGIDGVDSDPPTTDGSTTDGSTTHGATLDGLRAALQADRRFVQTSPEHFELTEWGATPYRAPAPARGAPPGRRVTAAHRCWLHVEVDEEVLAGSPAPVPVPLVEALGLRRGARRSFSTRCGPVALTHDAARPARGSLRPVALAAGAGVGDTLVLGFHPDHDDVLVRLEPAMPAGTTAP